MARSKPELNEKANYFSRHSEHASQVTDETWNLVGERFRRRRGCATHFNHFLERCRGPPLDETKLCQRCSNLRFEDKIGGKPLDLPAAPSHFVADMAVVDFSCTLCQFLQRLTPGHDHHFLCERPEGVREEITFSSSVVPDPNSVGSSSSRDASRWLKFSAYRDTPTTKTKGDQNWPKDSEMVNLDALKAKFELCKTTHRDVCGARKLPPVSGLLLINCETMKREAATADMEYVALSYVWGPAQQRIFLDEETLDEKQLPRTIRDAVNVTLQLGFKHLWVDQVCINQDGAHKMDQIRQMHYIYRNSEITIIAAAGSHSDYGIPGFPGAPRLPQILCRIGNRFLTEKKIDPDCRIEYTPWVRRGWTLQEEVMSRRTLFFTDREAWFSCACMVPILGREFADAKYSPNLKIGFAFRQQEAAKSSFTPLCTASANTLQYHSSQEFILLVEGYSGRDLTVTGDVIHAFSGILGMFEQSSPPVHQIWGSPILPLQHISSNGHYMPTSGYVLSNPRNPSLEGFLRGLCFQHKDRDQRTSHTPLVRRLGFPSWSWTGWIGPIRFYYLHEYDTGFNTDTGLSIDVECTDGTILSWEEFEELAYLKTHPQTISRFIHVQAWTMDVKLENHESRDESRKSCLYHVVQTSHGQQYNKVEFMNEKFEDLETEELRLLSTKTYAAILVSGIERLFKPLEGMYFMLVEIKTDHAERVGILKLEKDFQWWALKNRQWLNPGIASKKEIDVDGLKLQWKEIRLG